MNQKDWQDFAAGILAALNLKIAPDQQESWEVMAKKGAQKMDLNKEIVSMAQRRVTEERHNPHKDPKVKSFNQQHGIDPRDQIMKDLDAE